MDEDVPPELVESLCLDDRQLQALSDLASECERVYGAERDMEWAFAEGRLYLLQCRALTTSAGASAPATVIAPDALAESLVRVPLLSELAGPDRDAVARLFTERTFAPGETVTKEGADAAAFYLIESGTATVTVGGVFRRTLGPGDHFGEIALIDGRRAHGDRDRRRRARVPGHHAVGLPAARAAQPDHGLDPPADPRRHAAPARGDTAPALSRPPSRRGRAGHRVS